ncbi:hypothetical protein BDZ90DRAFT_68388 [Jaminaea rosea]|uniref:Uncharacterized protein n=1 Tax=Jaminaea rosea TaxID=1569628 RepID=A0A316UR10_9BASI|nr:hypothetical protein BDZ90DRAFT_68388 [Jaminaea rosea]PWN25565.1 hypothetical protein BDZ90DRAFT_68388 [Jaminaea rosea]
MDMRYSSSSSSSTSAASTCSSFSSPTTPHTMSSSGTSYRPLRSSCPSGDKLLPSRRDLAASRKLSLQEAQDALDEGLQLFLGARVAPTTHTYPDTYLLNDLREWQQQSRPQWTVKNPFGQPVDDDGCDTRDDFDESSIGDDSSVIPPSQYSSSDTSRRNSRFPFDSDSRCPNVPPQTAPASCAMLPSLSAPPAPSSSSSSSSVRDAARALFALSSAERAEAIELASQWKREETRMGRRSFAIKSPPKTTQLAPAQPSAMSSPPRRQRKSDTVPLPLLRISPPRPRPSPPTKPATSSAAEAVRLAPCPPAATDERKGVRTASALDSVANELALMSEMAREETLAPQPATVRRRSAETRSSSNSSRERRPSIGGVAAAMMSVQV